MKQWLRRFRGALRMGLTWAIPSALAGFLIELLHNIWPNPVGRMVDIWPAALAIPAFLGGVTFSILLGVVARGRRFDELSLPGFATLGATGGVLVSLGPAMMVAVGLASIDPRYDLWRHITLPLMGPLAIFGAVCAAGSLLLARRAERREMESGEPIALAGSAATTSFVAPTPRASEMVRRAEVTSTRRHGD